MQRRTFLAATAAAAALPRVAAASGDAGRPPVGAFTKSFQDWPVPKVCEKFAELGLDGLDLTVRPGGHIEPENAAAELPAAVAAAEANGVKILFLTTAITDAGPAADRLLGAAAESGVTTVKLGYFRIDGRPLADQIAATKRTLESIADLAATHGVTPCVHVHSGKYLPSHGTMLWELLRDLPPDRIGAYADTLHMHLEGGADGWRQGLALLAPWLRLCAVKNYRLAPAGRDKLGMRQWEMAVCPVADGVSPIPEFVADLQKGGFAGPFSLHSEYRGRHSFQNMDVDGVFEQTRADLKFFNGVVGPAFS